MKATKYRSWISTIHIGNMKKAGLTDDEINNPEYVTNFFRETWEESGERRKACVAACISANGLFHLHAALYGHPTTQYAVSKVMYDSHVEPVKSKQDLLPYILKEGKYAESGEQVLFIAGKDNINSDPGRRSDLDVIKDMIDSGMTPDEIMGENIRYRRYEKMINSEYDYQCRQKTPIKRKMRRVWHFGNYDSGIEAVNEKLCEKYGQEKVFYIQYTGFGSFDTYSKMGNPPVLVVDNIGADTEPRDLLQILNEYTNTRIKCRYEDISPFWTEVHLISRMPIEEYIQKIRRNISQKELLNKLDYVIYHYLQDGIPTLYKVPAQQYESALKIQEDIKNNIFYGELLKSREDEHYESITILSKY